MAPRSIRAGRASNPRPTAGRFFSEMRLQVAGGKNATGPLKFWELKNSVQLESPVATWFPTDCGTSLHCSRSPPKEGLICAEPPLPKVKQSGVERKQIP